MITAIKKGAKLRISPYFNSCEFDCKCENPNCTFTLYSIEMIKLLEQLRFANGNKPLIINSAFRCATHNKNEGGKPNSQHLVGLAVDIRCPIYLSFNEFKKLVYRIPFKFILPYPDEPIPFIHVDIRTGGF